METNRRGFFGMMAALMGSSIYTVAGEKETPQKKAEPTVIFQTITKEVYAPDLQRTIEMDADLKLCTHTIVLGDGTPPIFYRSHKSGICNLPIFIRRGVFRPSLDIKSEIITIGCPIYPSLYPIYKYPVNTRMRSNDEEKIMLVEDMFSGEISKKEALEQIEKIKKSFARIYSQQNDWEDKNPVFNIIYFRSRPEMKAYAVSTQPLELATNFV